MKSFLIWRQKEFIEKYEGICHETENDQYAIFDGELENGKGIVAVINNDLLEWNSPASHPWILIVSIKYDGSLTKGMPNEDNLPDLEKIENDIMQRLPDVDGFLNLGRQTADGNRDIYWACSDFRKPSKVLHEVSRLYASEYVVSYDIYKDKYWQFFNQFRSFEE